MYLKPPTSKSLRSTSRMNSAEGSYFDETSTRSLIDTSFVLTQKLGRPKLHQEFGIMSPTSQFIWATSKGIIKAGQIKTSFRSTTTKRPYFFNVLSAPRTRTCILLSLSCSHRWITEYPRSRSFRVTRRSRRRLPEIFLFHHARLCFGAV